MFSNFKKIFGLAFIFTSLSCEVEKPDFIVKIQKDLPETIDYNLHVKPILSDNCFACHGPDKNKQKAGLRLDVRENAIGELPENDGHYAVSPGSLKNSELFYRILAENPEERMPPIDSHLSLTDREKAILIKWIEQGAEYKPHWAYMPLQPSEQHNKIDDFIQAKLIEVGLEQNQEADKEALIRRLYFDITGLPPSLEEIDDFLNDESPDSYDNLVEKLLVKPEYGERMASYWLDIARYSDTHGYQDDQYRNIWPWRDWVIKAYNENMPYDQFIKWQLAGDLMENPSKDQIKATAFNRNHLINVEGGIIGEEFRTEYVADRTNTFGKAFLGITMECARCHDHKYDPVSQKEYYQLYAYFNSIDEEGRGPRDNGQAPYPTMMLTTDEQDELLEYMDGLIAEKESQLEDVVSGSQSRFEKWLESTDLKKEFNKEPTGLLVHYDMEKNNHEGLERVEEVTSIEGKVGGAVMFDGENNAVLQGLKSFERTESFSVSFWIKIPEDVENIGLFRKSNGYYGANRGFEAYLYENSMEFRLSHEYPGKSIVVRSLPKLEPNEWIHIAMTYNGSSKAEGVTIYKNGDVVEQEVVRNNLYKTMKIDRNVQFVQFELVVGGTEQEKGLKNGGLDELAFYGKELSEPEIKYLSLNKIKLLNRISSSMDLLKHDKGILKYYQLNHDREISQQVDDLTKARNVQNDTISRIPEMMIMKELDSQRTTYILERGQYDAKGDIVEPGLPEFLYDPSKQVPSNRLELAEWLVSKDNPLTPRVIVNRIWQLFFGQGLVTTPDDFGNQGKLPTHPELLDWLTKEFIESGWDMKALISQIVTSNTYKQASMVSAEKREKDPSNQWLARGPSYRLPSEMIRDNALASSGLLVKKVGGRSVKPYQPDGIWYEKASIIGERRYVRGTGEDLYRRSLYTYWRRTIPPPAMLILDSPEKNVCTVNRQPTSTPLQSLLMLNDVQYVEAAKKLAEKAILDNEDTPETLISYSFRMLTSRLPAENELRELELLYSEELERFQNDRKAAVDLLKTGESEVVRNLVNPQTAALTSVVNIIMNFDPVYTKR